MGFYFRKSFGLGPVRLNLSKGGVGVSAGVRGARIGVNSRGRTYVHCGRGGIYYRKTLGGHTGATSSRRQTPLAPAQTPQRGLSGAEQLIESDVAQMMPESAAELLSEIQARLKRT